MGGERLQMPRNYHPQDTCGVRASSTHLTLYTLVLQPNRCYSVVVVVVVMVVQVQWDTFSKYLFIKSITRGYSHQKPLKHFRGIFPSYSLFCFETSIIVISNLIRTYILFVYCPFSTLHTEENTIIFYYYNYDFF